MKLIQVCLLSIFLVIGITGCNAKVNIENITMSLLVGIDINEENKVEVYVSSPVFSKEAKEKNEHFEVESLSLKEARNYFDAVANGVTAGGKVQSILIGSKILEQNNWFSILDFLYRDPKIRLNADIVFVKGKVSDIFDFTPKDKPRLSIFLPQLIDTADFRNIIFRTSLRNFYQMRYDKGITPFGPELTLKKDQIELTGTALLNNENKYVRTLSFNETQLLKVLNDDLEGDLSLSLPLDKFKNKEDIFIDNISSFYVRDIRRKVHKKFKNGKYQFEIDYKLPIVISESPIKLNDKTVNSLQDAIEKELQKQLSDLMKLLQKDKVDPIGLGIYASTINYPFWKKNEDKWLDLYEKSKIKINLKVIIIDKGSSM